MARNKKRTSGKRKSRDAGALPTKDEILDYIRATPDRVGKRELGRAFGIKGGARVEFKRLLAEMADEGLISGPRKRITRSDELPSVTVIKITGRDQDGELIAEPATWNRAKAGDPPKILVLPDRRGRGGAAGIGDRLLARLEPVPAGMASAGISHQARTIKRLERDRGRLLGIFRSLAIGGGVIDPVNRKQLKEWPVTEGDTGGASDGELVRFELTKSGRYGVPKVKVVECLGDPEAQGKISLIAIHEHGLRDAFPDSVIQEAEQLSLPGLDQREDLRGLPLITIDPADARDHDDAVWAMADDDPTNEGGWIVMVSIADVSWFVRPGSALDKEALLRGNSVYFPDRVVPMLPEIISADLCSLREGEERACLAVRMVFDRNGDKRSHRFLRGLMRSTAKLTYQQAQDAFDGNPGPVAADIAETVLRPLWKAYGALRAARDRRAPLDLDLPERKILLDKKGQITDIVSPPRLEAHRLIEEFMIQANVAAAETLEKLRSPLIYRVHDAPSKEKTVALGDFLQTLDISLPKAGRLLPQHFNGILERARDGAAIELVSEVVLRCQSQAEYSPANLGHFGLNLRRYAHFTSPIRRYADLVVHRALVTALKLGDGGLTDHDAAASRRWRSTRRAICHPITSTRCSARTARS